MTTLEEISKVTQIDRVTRMLAEAANDMRKLESLAERVFPAWIKAQEEAQSQGMVADLKLTPGMTVALADYKQRLQKAEAREVVSTVFDRNKVGGSNGLDS